MVRKTRRRKGVPGSPPSAREVQRFDGKDYFLRDELMFNEVRGVAREAKRSGYNARITGPYTGKGEYGQYKLWLRKKKRRRK